jgi:hypothetical protein
MNRLFEDFGCDEPKEFGSRADKREHNNPKKFNRKLQIIIFGLIKTSIIFLARNSDWNILLQFGLLMKISTFPCCSVAGNLVLKAVFLEFSLSY